MRNQTRSKTCYLDDNAVIFVTHTLLQSNTLFYSVNFLKFDCLKKWHPFFESIFLPTVCTVNKPNFLLVTNVFAVSVDSVMFRIRILNKNMTIPFVTFFPWCFANTSSHCR